MGDIFGSGAMTITGLWLLLFYIEVAGLSPAAAASIFAIAKIWDGITDPIMGYHRQYSHALGATPNILYYRRAALLCFALMWVSGFGYSWYLGTYLLFSTVFTLLMVPYDTLPAEMTSRYDLRSKCLARGCYLPRRQRFYLHLSQDKFWRTSPINPQAFFYISAWSFRTLRPTVDLRLAGEPGNGRISRRLDSSAGWGKQLFRCIEKWLQLSVYVLFVFTS